MSVNVARERLTIAGQVIGALILRDMRTRFGGSYSGYLVAIVGPFVHVALLVTIFQLLGRTAPLGSDTTTFMALGILPFVLFSYPCRQIARSLTSNRPLLTFPRVKPLDVIAARLILEVLGACAVSALVVATLIFAGFEFEPHDFAMMMGGFASAVYYGVSLGCLAAVAAARWPSIASAILIPIILSWFLSGVFFLPERLPELLGYIVSFNPLAHSVTLVRVGYYPDFESNLLSVQYLFWVPTTLVFAALVMEYFMRRTILTR
jgi:capsular polysaccharide transport system permease protein